MRSINVRQNVMGRDAEKTQVPNPLSIATNSKYKDPILPQQHLECACPVFQFFHLFLCFPVLRMELGPYVPQTSTLSLSYMPSLNLFSLKNENLLDASWCHIPPEINWLLVYVLHMGKGTHLSCKIQIYFLKYSPRDQ